MLFAENMIEDVLGGMNNELKMGIEGTFRR